MATETHQRLTFLNHAVSKTKTRSSQRDQAPIIDGHTLLKQIETRYRAGLAIEFFGSTDDTDENARILKGQNADFIRIKHMNFMQRENYVYCVMLFEYGNQRERSLPLVDVVSFDGREIEGNEQEVGASCAHVVVRMPTAGQYDDGRYRCAIEYVYGGITRRNIELFFGRQLRRYSDSNNLTFPVVVKQKKGRTQNAEHRYHSSFELMADFGRQLDAFRGEAKILSGMLFTKRSERRSTGQPTDVKQVDFEADVEIRVSASQGPDDIAERATWASAIRRFYSEQGYKTQLSYRYASGAIIKGIAGSEVAGAADLLLCPKEYIYLPEEPRRWRASPDAHTTAALCGLVDRDELWERAK